MSKKTQKQKKRTKLKRKAKRLKAQEITNNRLEGKEK